MSNMELDPRSSMYVAPLQIGKDASRTASRGSDRPGTSSSAYYSTSTQQTGQATPPLTPHDPQQTFEQNEEFTTYLRASYSYHPSSTQGSSTVTLPLNVGDVILVHSIHTNGWADGTLLASGARGWLPTNYCEGYSNDYMRSLLKALTAFWDLAKGGSNRIPETFRNPEYVRGLVAGVRCLLERTSCLTRESQLVQTHYAIRRHRKVLLSDLTSFVKVTKAIQNAVENVNLQEDFEVDLDGTIMKAFGVIIRAVKFCDVWDDHMQSIGVSPWHPPTPPADRTGFAGAENDNLASAETRHNAAVANTADARMSNEHRPAYNRGSEPYIRPGGSNACRQPDRPSSRQAPRGFAAHRVSCNVHPGSQNLASEKLGGLHNAFLTHLGYFIGLHMQSRASSEILITTRHSVLACRDMLELVEDVWVRDRKRSRVLKDARDNVHRKIGDLAEAAQYVFRPLRSEEEDLLLPSEGQPLIDAATACVRAAGECVAESRFIIDRIGDYAFEPLGLGIDNLSSSNFPHHSMDSQQRGTVTTRTMEEPEASSRPSTNLPPPPPDRPALRLPSGMFHASTEGDLQSVETATDASAPQASSTQLLLPPLPPFAGSLLPQEDQCTSPVVSVSSSGDGRSIDSGRDRTDSLGVSSTGNSSTYIGSLRDSEASAVSQTSTRATSPDAKFANSLENLSVEQAPIAMDQPSSSGSSQRTCNEDVVRNSKTLIEDMEENILEQTFAHELVYNKDGQITGGTLPALIERLTTPDSTPDATFVSTFYLTFRLFASPIEFAQALIDRFNYVGNSPRVASPVRLRVYNVFKGWLESHWRNDCDTSALDLITTFATRQLQLVLPTAGKRLATLAIKVTSANGPLVPRLISSMGKTNTSIAQYIPPNTPIPTSMISKSQLSALKNWKHGGASISVLDFGPLELARQLTIKESQIFCSILPEELLASEWTKQSGSMAVNVREMSRLSNDISNLVAESILEVEDFKKRAVIVKQWIKIADKLLELSNYHSLMAIVCSLGLSTIRRLKRTWEQVSSKTKSTLERLRSVINIERNYASLKKIFQNQVPPCIPWVGLYLTHLTFVDIGNQTTRQLPGDKPGDSKSVINFDKHMKTAKIISELQRFQVPYRLQEVPELQTWMQDQLVRVRTNDQSFVVKDQHRRSLLLEPQEQAKSSPKEPQTSQFSLFKSKEKTAPQSSAHNTMLPIH